MYSQFRKLDVDCDVGGDGKNQHGADDEEASPVHFGMGMRMFDDRRLGMLLLGAKVANDEQRDAGGDIGIEDR